jgi:hypothetical protein
MNRFGPDGQTESHSFHPAVRDPHPLSPVTTVAAGVTLACGLAAALALGRSVAGLARRRPSPAAARTASWAGLLGALVAVAGAAHGLGELAMEHPHGWAVFGQGEEVLKIAGLMALGATAILLAAAARPLTGPHDEGLAAPLPAAFVTVVTCAGVALAAVFAAAFWNGLSLADFSSSPPHLYRCGSEALALAAGCSALGAGIALALPGVTLRARGAAWRGLRPGSTILALAVAAASLAAFLSPSVASLAWAREFRPFSMALVAAAAGLPVLALWGLVIGHHTARAGRAAAWTGAVASGICALGLAHGAAGIEAVMHRLGAALIPSDFAGIPGANSILVPGAAVILAAWTLAATCRVRVADSPPSATSPWPARVHHAGLLALSVGAVGFGVNLYRDLRVTAGAHWLKWGAVVFLAALATEAGIAVAVAVRGWRSSRGRVVPALRRVNRTRE